MLTSPFLSADKVEPVKLVDSVVQYNPFINVVKIISDEINSAEGFIFEFVHQYALSGDLKPAYWMQEAIEDIEHLKSQITRLEEMIKAQCDEIIDVCIENQIVSDGSFEIRKKPSKRGNRSVDKGIFRTLYPDEFMELINARIVDIKRSYKPSIKEVESVLGTTRAKHVIIQGHEIDQGYEVRPVRRGVL